MAQAIGPLSLALQVYSSPTGGTLLHDWSIDATRLQITTGPHGYETLQAQIDLQPDQAYRAYSSLLGKHIQLVAGGQAAWAGRIEDLAPSDRGLGVGALGYWQALADYGPYTALWSDASVSRWAPVTEDHLAATTPPKWRADTNNRLYIAPVTGESYAPAADEGGLYYQIPSQSLRDINAVQFKVQFLGPSSDWIFRFRSYNAGFTSGANLLFLAGTGSLITCAYYLEPASVDIVAAFMLYNGGGKTTYTGETGIGGYLKITQIRVATSQTNKINTTIAAGVGSTGSQVVTPGNMSRIYVGQDLVIGSGSSGEMITVTAITSTTFTAVFTKTHGASVTVQGICIYADEIIGHIVAQANSLNSSQIQAATGLLSAGGRDLLIELYQDGQAQDIATYLAAEGASSIYDVGVWDSRILYYWARGSYAREWQIDIASLDLSASLGSLHNALYSLYQSAEGVPQRTSTATDTSSPSRYGLTRRKAITASTTSATQAEALRDQDLADRATIRPRARIVALGLYDASGQGPYPLWLARAGDTMTIRNIPATLSAEVDRIRHFNLAGTRYDALADTLIPIPEQAAPDLDIIIVQDRKAEALDRIRQPAGRLAPTSREIV